MLNIVKSGFAVVLSSLVLTACGGGTTISSAAPTGTFEGTAWSMTKATVHKNSDDTLDVKIFGDQVADCANTSSGAGYLLFSMPAKVGKRPLKFSLDFSDPNNQTVTFVTPPANNNIATEGLLDLTAISDTSVTLGLNVKAGNSNVDGTFTATLCK